jgi:Zn-dependent protease/CBS domain-containing protein
LFLGCILLHELAPSLVARRYGLRVRSITLFLFGGVSNIEREPPSPAAELLMAIVGPITSILLGFGILAVWVAFARAASVDVGVGLALGNLGALSTLLLWLGPVNVVIGLFNLVPGFPLDGGRVLRALLWWATGDLHKATRWAGGVGQAIGWSFVAAGVAVAFGLHLPLIGSGLLGGLWFAFIGWYLAGAARSSYQGLLVHEALEGETVGHLMRPAGPSVEARGSVTTAARDGFLQSDARALPVIEGGAFVGLLSVTDLRRIPREQWAATSVGAIMTPLARVAVTTPGESLSAAMRRLGDVDVHQLPVVSDGRLVGMLSAQDVARWLQLRVDAGASAGSAGTHSHA